MCQAFAFSINIAIIVDGLYVYKDHCNVELVITASTARRSEPFIMTYTATVDPTVSNVRTAGVTDPTAFVNNINNVVASNPSMYMNSWFANQTASVSDITSVSAATSTTVTLEGGTAAPTNAPSESSDLDIYLIVIIVLACLLVVAVVVLVVVKVLNDKSSADKKIEAPSTGFLDAADAPSTTVPMEPVYKPSEDTSDVPHSKFTDNDNVAVRSSFDDLEPVDEPGVQPEVETEPQHEHLDGQI